MRTAAIYGLLVTIEPMLPPAWERVARFESESSGRERCKSVFRSWNDLDLILNPPYAWLQADESFHEFFLVFRGNCA